MPETTETSASETTGEEPVVNGSAETAGASGAPLGPAGEKALEEWKRRAREAERTSKAQAARLEELEDRDKSELQKAAERVTKSEARAAQAVRRAAQAEVRALASAKFADPSDAVAFLDIDSLLGDDGDVDSRAIESALADLLKRKPHLAKEQAPPSFEGGARTTASRPTDMNSLIRQKAGLG